MSLFIRVKKLLFASERTDRDTLRVKSAPCTQIPAGGRCMSACACLCLTCASCGCWVFPGEKCSKHTQQARTVSHRGSPAGICSATLLKSPAHTCQLTFVTKKKHSKCEGFQNSAERYFTKYPYNDGRITGEYPLLIQ